MIKRNIHNFYRPEKLYKRIFRFIFNRNIKYSFKETTENYGDANHEKKKLLSNIKENRESSLFKEILQYPFIWIYLHGSQGDNTTTAFSDYDDLLVIDTDKIQNYKLGKVKRDLRKVDMRFCRNDFLQHHGHWIITKNNLLNYDASYMPLCVLDTCKVIQGPLEFSYAINRQVTRAGLKNNILSTINFIREAESLYNRGNINIYNLKRLVGSYVLIPAMIFQLKEIEINKPEAIRRSPELYSEEALQCIKWSTFCRDHWDSILDDRRVYLFKKIPYFFHDPFKYRKFIETHAPIVNLESIRFNSLKQENSNRFCEETLKFIKYVD